jgi:hypothetical protein
VSASQRPAAPGRRLIIVSGEEGAGKSTIVRALLPSTPHGARIDAEDIGQTNPCPMDDTFFGLLRQNLAGLVVMRYQQLGKRRLCWGCWGRHRTCLICSMLTAAAVWHPSLAEGDLGPVLPWYAHVRPSRPWRGDLPRLPLAYRP